MCQCSMQSRVYVYFFFFNDTATTEIYTLSLHDALPISWGWTWVDYSPWGFSPYHYGRWNYFGGRWGWCPGPVFGAPIYGPDRKSTRLNSSHLVISYAVFCLKKNITLTSWLQLSASSTQH